MKEGYDPLDVWINALTRIFKLPASIVLVIGDWKTGKTDFSLLLAEELVKLGIVKKVASNIHTKDSKVKVVEDAPTLKSWVFADSVSKLYIYDESITATPKRRAMSKLNVFWLKEIIPELSKGKGKLIVISQELDFTESVFYHPTFLRGMFRKITRKSAILNSPLLSKETTFTDIPRTSIKFDPYRIATFSMEKTGKTEGRTEGQTVAILYRQGLSMDQIGKKLKPPKHRMQVARILRKYLQSIEEKMSQVTYNSAKDKAP